MEPLEPLDPVESIEPIEPIELGPDDDDASPSQPQDPSPTEGKENLPTKKQNVRKRTKTGCLTCRKRRIKCDEGKPTCNNCIKSKRHCEGYNQRVIFKEPNTAFHGAPFAPILYQAEPAAAPFSSQLSAAQPKSSSSNGSLATIAPKPPHLDFATTRTFPQGPVFPGQQRSASIPTLNWSPGVYSHPSISPDGPLFSPQPPSAGAQLNYAHDDSPIHGHIPRLMSDPALASLPSGLPLESPLSISEESPGVSIRDGNIHQESMQMDGDYWYSDDDASMAESEDERHPENQKTHLEANELGLQIAQQLDGQVDLWGTQMRTFSSFPHDDVLATYIPSSTNSPLNDTQTAAIFWYFVNATGPIMSLYERHPFDPSPMFQGRFVPRARQHIWTYTLPIISLNHPALLQAMLALGSLQMAKLQGVPATASMKHYHLSLRRIAKNYQSPSRRVQPATLAATLLLGFYEVWNSDHDLWCKHMWGARAILKEIPLGEMSRAILSLKRKRRQRLDEIRSEQHYDSEFAQYDQNMTVDYDDVNTTLLSQISGHSVNYDESSYVSDGPYWKAPKRYTERDMETFELVRDLFWWYCKMDVYQSFLGATRLLMDYTLWTQCTPRAPIGRIDAVFGTFDHLMLLLGRLANFSSRDRARKQLIKGPGGPGGPPGQSPPLFAGMMPSRGAFTVPTGFSPPREPTPPGEGPEDEMDMEARTKAALLEWDEVRQAFDVFKSHLGPDFEAMGPEYAPPMETPFGPALSYRTYSIAGIWMNFYMGMIVLYRSHPSMPPVAMIAAGMAARQTVQYSLEVGRIASGLVAEDLSNVSAVSTLVGAALIESCFPLFVGGIQFQNPQQRHWIINRMHNVSRLTGWQSARQIAGGCEAAWLKAASVGRGPPYHPATDLDVQIPQSVWTRPRRIDERIRELDDNNGKVVLSTAERPKYALGLLSMEDDLKKLDLRDEDS